MCVCVLAGTNILPWLAVRQVSAEEAEARIRAANEPYKLEILQSILERTSGAPITIYHIGEKENPMHWCVEWNSSRRHTRSLACHLPPAAPHVTCFVPRQFVTYLILTLSVLVLPGRWDLCAGPHVERTGEISAEGFDLESVAGGEGGYGRWEAGVAAGQGGCGSWGWGGRHR